MIYKSDIERRAKEFQELVNAEWSKRHEERARMLEFFCQAVFRETGAHIHEMTLVHFPHSAERERWCLLRDGNPYAERIRFLEGEIERLKKEKGKTK